MSRFVRLGALLLAFLLLTCSASSCRSSNSTVPPLQRGDKPASSVRWDSDYRLDYALTHAHLQEYLALLEDCVNATLYPTDFEQVREGWARADECYRYISTQSQVAYVLYCINSVYEQEYLESSSWANQAYNGYLNACLAVYESDSPYKEEFFSSWTDENIKDMLWESDVSGELYKEYRRILSDYRDLDISAQREEMADVYRRFVENRNAMAQEFDFASYYDWMSAVSYGRTYTGEERVSFRQYVKEYLVPLLDRTSETMRARVEGLTDYEYKLFSAFFLNDYDQLPKDYLTPYLASFDEEQQVILQSLFDDENSAFIDSAAAVESAFTVYMEDFDSAFCYFGPGYQSLMTVVHEMGHYYADKVLLSSTDLLDLAETQSQGNEWLLMAFLEDEMSATLYEAILYYQACFSLSAIVLSTAVDEFEEAVYTGKADLQNLDTEMESIGKSYGGVAFLEEFTEAGDLGLYWRNVVVSSPVYYLSYAVSGVAAMALYLEAEADYPKAQSMYRALVEESYSYESYTELLAAVGLSSPFEAEVYGSLLNLFAD